MRLWQTWPALVLAGGVIGLCAGTAQEEKAPAKGNLIVIDNAGKEQKLVGWKLVVGTRRLGWLAPPTDPKDKSPRGPEVLEFRDDKSTTFVDGVLTLIPLDRLRAIEYDNDKQIATLKVATDKADADEVLNGTTKYKGTNKLAIEAEADKGDMGVAAVKYLGGSKDGGIKGVRFPSPQGVAPPAGRAATVTVIDKMQKNVQNAVDLQPLYRMQDGSERLTSFLVFKKTYKLELAMLQKVTATPGAKPDEPEWTISVKEGEGQTLTLLKATMIDDKPATLIGLVGKVPVGYKLFPAHVISEIQFDAK